MNTTKPADRRESTASAGPRRFAAFLLAVAVMLAAGVATPPAGQGGPEGDPFLGRELFVDKGCGDCHSIWGYGGTLGPDIVVSVAGKTWYELVGDFWNHTPRMIDEVRATGFAWPELESSEMADTLSYLYYLQLFDKPGNAERGKETYSRLHCDACHELGDGGGEGGGPLDGFGVYPSPAPLAQAMWNAGPRMQVEQLRRGDPIPEFTRDEMADLQAYIRAESHREAREITLQPLPDPVRGAEIYRQKSCGVCHAAAAGEVPDISRSALSKTFSEITGLLWNHSYAMSAEMADRGLSFPQFSGTEMSDLIAHLYFLGYVSEEGDAEAGALVFADKGCAGCHEGEVEGVRDLAAGAGPADRVELAAAMWNHAPQMHDLMAEESPFWPKFERGEMRDLVAYLRKKRSP